MISMLAHLLISTQCLLSLTRSYAAQGVTGSQSRSPVSRIALSFVLIAKKNWKVTNGVAGEK